MSFEILPTKEFSKDFKKLDNQLQTRIKKKIEEVAEDPTRFKHLHYDLKGSCRLWIGKLRIIFYNYMFFIFINRKDKHKTFVNMNSLDMLQWFS